MYTGSPSKDTKVGECGLYKVKGELQKMLYEKGVAKKVEMEFKVTWYSILTARAISHQHTDEESLV